MRPILLLDVDGVLNAVTDEPPKTWTDWRITDCNGYPIHHSPEMGRQIAALDADIVWLTTWGLSDLANQWVGALFDWPEYPTLGMGGSRFAPGWWKSFVAEEYLRTQPGRPFIWIDDDLSWSINNGDVPWLGPDGCLLISPDTRTGLMPEAIAHIRAWIAGLR